MYFNVKVGITIGNKNYKPCICYALPLALRATVANLAKEGKAEITDRPVFFQNGKKLEPVKTAETDSIKSKAKSRTKKTVKTEETEGQEQTDSEGTEGF